MGMGKWVIKHGVGSPGAVAKALVKAFIDSRKLWPDMRVEELLFVTLKTRMLARSSIGLQVLSDDEMESVIENCEGSLFSLIMFILHYEDDFIETVRVEQPEIYELIIQVVCERMGQYGLAP